MQVVDKDGNIFGAGLEVTGSDGKPKTISGGGAPSGPAGGDLSGTYPNPSVVWNNGTSTYNALYYPLSSNPAGYLTSAALTPYLTITLAASTYYPIPTGTVSQYIRGDGTLATFPTIPSVTPAALTKTDDTNVTLTLGGSPSTALLQATSLTLGWTGTLADSRIASAATWNAKQNAITLTTTGTSGPATLVGSTLNIPQYTGGGGGGGVTTLSILTTGATVVTGTTANTITRSVLIPANTITNNNSIDIIARFSKTGSVGGGNYRLYVNTSNSLTGASLISNFYTIAGGASITTHQNQRTFFYNSSVLSTNSTSIASVTDIQQNVAAVYNVSYNPTVDTYLIFAIQLTNGADSSVMTANRIIKYA
jgi:hypothetical protein